MTTTPPAQGQEAAESEGDDDLDSVSIESSLTLLDTLQVRVVVGPAL